MPTQGCISPLHIISIHTADACLSFLDLRWTRPRRKVSKRCRVVLIGSLMVVTYVTINTLAFLISQPDMTAELEHVIAYNRLQRRDLALLRVVGARTRKEPVVVCTKECMMDRLCDWLSAHGGVFHPRIVFDVQGPFGVSVLAPKLVEDTTIVTCPFSLIITKRIAAEALKSLLGDEPDLDVWSERQLIVSYLCFHYVCSQSSFPDVLRHLPYVQSLPLAERLLSSLYFTIAELEILRGTNLYGATLDRERDWRAEWDQCRSLVRSVSSTWADVFTWELYKSASTHLSSRAFPSSILSPNPSLVASPSTYPVLIPGVDLLNHKRSQPVSWVVSCQNRATDTISLVAHPQPQPDTDNGSTDDLAEVFNNYGPKPNDELILGYGFSIADNPDDTITLQIGGSPVAQKWVVGRHGENADGLWCDVRSRVALGQNEYEFEDELDTAGVLSDMVQAKLDGMKTVDDVRRCDRIRPAVQVMLEHYIAGQREILESILVYANEKQREAIENAKELGIDLVLDNDI